MHPSGNSKHYNAAQNFSNAPANSNGPTSRSGSSMARWAHCSLRAYVQHYPMRMRGIYEGGFDALRISLDLYNSAAEVQRVMEVGASIQKA